MFLWKIHCINVNCGCDAPGTSHLQDLLHSVKNSLVAISWMRCYPTALCSHHYLLKPSIFVPQAVPAQGWDGGGTNVPNAHV